MFGRAVSAWMNLRSRNLSIRGSRALALGPIALLVLALLALVALDPNALCLLPVLVLAVPLLLRRYPGERLLGGFRETRRLRWSRPRSSIPRGARRIAVAAHGGQLIARALAVRPPPALPAAS
jgi:hypothetical protein